MASPQACLIYVMIVIQLMGILSIVLVGIWLGTTGDDKGYGFKDSKRLLNLHGLFMSMGVFLISNGIVLYRAFRKYQARNVKWVHFLFQLIAVIIFIMGFSFTIVARNKIVSGSKAPQQYRNATDQAPPAGAGGAGPGGKKHFYSAHSWLGLLFFIMICLQFLAGLFVFAFKVVNKSSRELFAAVHAFFGIFVAMLAGFVAVIGIQSHAKTEIAEYDKVVQAGVMANVASLAIVVMLAHVLYISVNPFFEWDVNDDTLEANPIE